MIFTSILSSMHFTTQAYLDYIGLDLYSGIHNAQNGLSNIF